MRLLKLSAHEFETGSDDVKMVAFTFPESNAIKQRLSKLKMSGFDWLK
jgi:hypothetical protein